MKKTIIALLVLSLLLVVSCATVSVDTYNPNSVGSVTTKGTSYEDDLVSVVVAYDNTKGYTLVTIYNKSDNLIQLDYNQSSLVQNSRSLRIVDGETRKIDTARIQANISIAPKSTVTRTIFLTDTYVTIQDNSILYLAFVSGDTTHYCTINFDAQYKETTEKTVLGTVSDTFSLWHVFFCFDTEEYTKAILLGTAEKQYGRDDIMLENINYEAKWSIASLLLGYDILGYVQKIEATATVVCYE